MFFVLSLVLILGLCGDQCLPTALNTTMVIVVGDLKDLQEPKGVVGRFNGPSTVRPVARSCQWEGDSKEWVCDFDMPKISEFVRRLRNTDDHGKATTDNSVWFYTNLGTTQTTLVSTLEWPVQWLERHQVSYYSIFDGLNMGWLREQKDFVRGNGALMEGGFFDKGSERLAGQEAYDELVRCHNQATATAAINPDAYIFTAGDKD